jgi:hypothetical protein
VVARLRWREQQLAGAHVGTGFQQVDGKGVPKRMRADRFGQAAAPVGLLAGVRDRHRGDVTAGSIARKEPPPRFGHAPPSAQHLPQLGREHHVAIFLALCVGEIYVAVVSQVAAIKAFSRY